MRVSLDRRGREKRSNGPSNCHALRRATRRVTQLYDHALSPVGLRGTRFSLLAELERCGATTLKRLSDAMVLDRATPAVRPFLAIGYLTLSMGEEQRKSCEGLL